MSIIEFRPTSGVTGHFSVEMKFRGASKFTARRSARQVVTGDAFSLNFGSDQVEQSNFSAQLRHCIQSKKCGDVIKDGVGEN